MYSFIFPGQIIGMLLAVVSVPLLKEEVVTPSRAKGEPPPPRRGSLVNVLKTPRRESWPMCLMAPLKKGSLVNVSNDPRVTKTSNMAKF